ncbi:sigma-54 dependent transcriptional regulator [Atopomonas sediminilitoris]|uniref:sigma-54 dependent transcriptional regulator n=1 Tax=Atopomonas sediminilitoris TaxID=2919919 RepID=UPI001F4D6B7B|nr:sigma-54 dependent transcriptional regulator [Atopomonas sediminilitoris]MCJ8167759.1 sigma-54 dependent transcriptional regulator [Atopomonas sediminilitoris]
MSAQLDGERRLLVVNPSEACRPLLSGLEESGWLLQTCGYEHVTANDSQIGLLDLNHEACLPPAALKPILERGACEWIAILRADMLHNRDMADFVGEWFFDYHTLPCDHERMHVALGRAYGMARLRSRRLAELQATPELLGDSRVMRELRALLSKLAPTDSSVLITGESGTGKELVARSLHRGSVRRVKPFVAINCGAIPEALIQSELFGHERGAFTGAAQRKIGRIEQANGGTLFLDEIGDLPHEMQVNLLRFLQERCIERVGGNQMIPVDVRVLAATHVDLVAAMREGRFREDLYYRLNVLPVHTAALRERTHDIPQLAEYFGRLYSQETGRRPRRYSAAAQLAMAHHAWPGNVRELANRVRRGQVLAEGKEVQPEDLGLADAEINVCLRGSLTEYREQAERQALTDALACHANNLSEAARVLDVSRPTLYRLLDKHALR